MQTYPKIQTVFKRDEKGYLLYGRYSLPAFEYLKDNEWLWTEKVNGTNIRVHWDCGEQTVRFGGRTDNAQIPAFLYDKLAELFTKDVLAAAYPETTMTLYGEGYGAKIQKGGGNYKPDGVGFVLFDVLVAGWWLQRADMEDVAGRLGLRVVPIAATGTLTDAIGFAEKGFSSAWGGFSAEGLVLRPSVDLLLRSGERVIAKIKHKDFMRCHQRAGRVK